MEGQLIWYFDYLSPFSYLQFCARPELFQRHEIVLRPVLFAGLLKHWGGKGAAETPIRRKFTYRFVVWRAKQLGVPIRFPLAHPFNPVPALRLTIALGATYEVVKTIFEFVWRDGRSVDAEWPVLCERLGVRSPLQQIEDSEAKAKLLRNGQAAIDDGVFGVPTFVLHDHIFWGEDASQMLTDYMKNPDLFESPEMASLDAVSFGISTSARR